MRDDLVDEADLHAGLAREWERLHDDRHSQGQLDRSAPWLAAALGAGEVGVFVGVIGDRPLITGLSAAVAAVALLVSRPRRRPEAPVPSSLPPLVIKPRRP